jgi:hypothetical protein
MCQGKFSWPGCGFHLTGDWWEWRRPFCFGVSMATLRVCLISAVVAAVVAAVTTFVTLRVISPAPLRSANAAIQEGTAEIQWGEELEVYYQTPFASPPHLTFPEGLEDTCHVADQKAGSFKLRRDIGGNPRKPPRESVKWKAEGQPVNSSPPGG